MISSKRFRDDHHLGSIRGNIGFKFPRNAVSDVNRGRNGLGFPRNTVSDVNRERNGLGFPRNTVQDANRGKSEGNSPGERQGCRFIGQCQLLQSRSEKNFVPLSSRNSFAQPTGKICTTGREKKRVRFTISENLVVQALCKWQNKRVNSL